MSENPKEQSGTEAPLPDIRHKLVGEVERMIFGNDPLLWLSYVGDMLKADGGAAEPRMGRPRDPVVEVQGRIELAIGDEPAVVASIPSVKTVGERDPFGKVKPAKKRRSRDSAVLDVLDAAIGRTDPYSEVSAKGMSVSQRELAEKAINTRRRRGASERYAESCAKRGDEWARAISDMGVVRAWSHCMVAVIPRGDRGDLIVSCSPVGVDGKTPGAAAFPVMSEEEQAMSNELDDELDAAYLANRAP